MDEKDILLKTIEGLKRYFHLDSCVWICMRVKRLQRKSLIKKKKGFRRRNPISVIGLGFEPRTHSLEGCCSIQLSYLTILCLVSQR